MDTGASFSVVNLSFLEKLTKQGLQFQVRPSKRQSPCSASNHKLETMGDVVLNLKFECEKGELEVQNIRFTVLRTLSVNMILGIEALVSLDLRVDRTSITILNRRIPLCETTQIMQMEVIDAIIPNDGITVAYLRTVTGQAEVNAKSNYLVTPIFPEDRKDVLQSGTPDSIDINTCLIKGSELKADFNYYFYSEKFNLPKIIEFKLEEVDDKQKWKPNKGPVINSLQERKEFINDEVINQMVEDSELSLSSKRILKQILSDERSVFSASEFDVGSYEEEEIELELLDTTPVYVKPRRVPYKLRDVLDDSIREMCKKQIIEETKGSNYNSPVHLVRKAKTNKWRFCTDYRQLNAKLKQNRYPLPRIQDLLEKLQGSAFLSAIDLKHGFFNINLSKKTADLTAFSVDGKQYRYLKLPMGLSISPQIFQRIMMDILKEDLGKGLIVYLDDVLVYSSNEQDHLKLLAKLFKKFSRAGILLNPSKCQFGRIELDYLGFTICKEGYRAQKNKTETIRLFPAPTTKKALKRFIGMASFYGTVVPNLQYTMGPLHEIAGLKSSFKWGADQEEAFERVKELLVNSATLAFPSHGLNSKLVLSTDASSLGWGAALTELGEDGLERPIGFTSGRFRNASERWCIAEKEAFAFINALNFFYVYLYGSSFIFRTDNKSLSFLKSTSFTKKPSGVPNWKTIRWLEFIAQFDFTVELHAGTADCMKTPDCLSRQFEHGVPYIHQLTEVIVKEPFWIKHSMCMADYIEEQALDKELQSMSGGWKTFLRMKWQAINKDGLIYLQNPKKQTKLAVPNGLQERLIEFMHLPLHTSQNNMASIIREKYSFPYLQSKLTAYIKNCETCVSVKGKKKKVTSKIITSQPHHPWESLQVDLIGPMATTLNKNQYVLSAICTFTRWCELRPLKDRQAITVAEALLEIFLVRGPPLNIQFDNAKEFQSKFLEAFLKDMYIYSQKICPYHPESNGIVESLNKRIKIKMQILEVDPIYWDKELPAIQLAINLERLQLYGTSPFQLLHGWLLEPPSFVDLKTGRTNENSMVPKSEWLKTSRIRMAHALADHFRLDQEVKLRRTGNQEDSNENLLTPGTKVLRYVKQPPGTCAKLFRNWKGIFDIVEKLDRHTYVIARTDDRRKKYIVHRSNLRPLGTVNKEIDHQSHVQETETEKDPITEHSTESNGLDMAEQTDKPPKPVEEVRRSQRLKEKTVNFKQYFYDE